MKKLVLILFASSFAFGIESILYTATTSTPILSEYSTASESTILRASRAHRLGMYINNTTGSTVACFLTHANASSFPNRSLNTVSEEIFLPTNTAATLQNVYTAPQIYCRSTTGSNITSGNLLIHVW